MQNQRSRIPRAPENTVRSLEQFLSTRTTTILFTPAESGSVQFTNPYVVSKTPRVRSVTILRFFFVLARESIVEFSIAYDSRPSLASDPFLSTAITCVQLNLTNFHRHGFIGFINYACTLLYGGRVSSRRIGSSASPICTHVRPVGRFAGFANRASLARSIARSHFSRAFHVPRSAKSTAPGERLKPRLFGRSDGYAPRDLATRRTFDRRADIQNLVIKSRPVRFDGHADLLLC